MSKHAKTLREIIDGGFEGFPRNRLEFWSPEDLPVQDWSNDWDGNQCERFTKGELFEEVDLRTWICTDTRVGLYAILWSGELIAFTYQRARKCDRVWHFTHQDGEKRMWESFMSYAEPPTAASSCGVIKPDDGIYNAIFDPTITYDWETGPFSDEDFQ